MRYTALLLALLACVTASQAAFLPLTLEQKAADADLIVVGTAVSVTRLLPEDVDGSVEADHAHYMGPEGVAVIRVSEVWKRPSETRSFTDDPFKAVVPRYIMIPCDYRFHESPSSLTEGWTYVLFLRQLGDNFFHPLDPASTHVVSDGRVAKFGMNHPPTQEFDFVKKSLLFKDFKTTVGKLVHTAKNRLDETPAESKSGG